MSEKLKKLLDVAQKTKIALYSEWEKKHFFEDYNDFYEAGRGIISESMGLTSVMLLLVRFAENPEVFEQKKNDPKTLEIITSSLEYIYDTVFADGYIATPLRTSDETHGVIDKEKSYVDTLTWVLSSSVLIIYSIRQELLELDDTLEKKAVELMSDSLARLLNGQLECGAWGFSTDKKAKRSLYSTYAAAAALADFLDYIFGELEYYETEENQQKDPKEFYDWQTVNEINNYYKTKNNPVYPNVDITDAVAEVKSKLQEWLIKNCLPLLPKISTCVPLDDKDRELLGITNQTPQDLVKTLGNKDYINLYYTFYIIDILTTSSSDKRYPEIINGNDSISLDDLKKTYQKTLSSSDYNYYFEKNKGQNACSLFNEFINQAVHSARMNFSIAQRTGKDFWENDNKASELNIIWEHEILSRERLADVQGNDGFSEPTLVPMALRANAVYCFYIIERADVTVDNLFELICNDRSEKSEKVKKDIRVKDLWDGKNYSLPITERSIEALVDYYDYLEKIDVSETVMKADRSVTSIDEAVDSKIESYIRSDAGLKLLESLQEKNTDTIDEESIIKIIDDRINKSLDNSIEQKINARLKKLSPSDGTDSSASASEIDTDKIIEILENLQRYLINKKVSPERNSSEARERLAYALIQTFKILGEKSILESVEDCIADIENEKAFDISEKINDQLHEFLEAMVKNYNNPAGNIANIYAKNSC